MPPVLLALEAMATRFELVLHGEDRVGLRAAGEEALREIERLERTLSCYRADSEISAVNAHAAHGPVKVSLEVMRLLLACGEVWRASGGAFDVAVGALVRAWNLASDTGVCPEPSAVAAARAASGMQHVELDPEASAVRFVRPGVSLDLGAVGKGYAVDVAIGALREAGVTSALLHGGRSSVHAIGAPPGADAWRIGIRESAGLSPRRSGAPAMRDEPGAAVITLSDSALSVSAGCGKSFVHEGREYGHVIDPRTGKPVTVARRAWVTGSSSLLCDALSTALLVNGPSWTPTLRDRWPGYLGYAGSDPETAHSSRFPV